MPCEWSQSHIVPLDDSGNHGSTATSALSSKRHAACDECRKRKLKCSGEPTGCSRCSKQSLVCHYSIQKQMGRPPKKRVREDSDHLSISGLPSDETWIDMDRSNFASSSSSHCLEATATSDAYRICAPVFSAPFSIPQGSTDDSHNHSWQLNHGKVTEPVPATTGPWPDFSSVSAATSNPFAVPPGLSHMHSPPVTPSDLESPENQCTCLSYLYLCLSHLSSLTPFPISQHTLCSLFIAAKTARAVIRCQTCPTKFATAMQNVMFTGTLLNVVADAWLRVSKTDAEELGKQAAPPAYVAAVNKNSPDRTAAWKDWLHQIVRSGVIGGPVDPAGSVACSDSPSLLSLVQEMERRQRKWHLERHPQARPGSPNAGCEQTNETGLDPRDEQGWLCVRVARSAREVISRFGFEPHEYPDDVVA
ncbi:C6 finger domain protein [Aspergillus coremiiformis]|uniref:C6 finger domain protein n=1 Tax=Aspergillus coremiiformis TaxID=138285 RepID=A0A5N6ZA14_9EURO|nr:C6 finger domain protein [Aspergillus coremiiformis]